MFQSEGWLGPMKVVRQGDSDTFTCVWPHQDVQLVLLSSYGFRLAAGASEVDAVYGPVCACHGREGAGVSCRSAEKDCKYKTRCKYKTQKKTFEKTRQYFSNADSLLLVHNSPSCVFKRFYAGENKPRRAQFSNLTQSAPGLQKDISKER